jgi:aryl-alcohol dehydrogenase-like predicted oxidoreductase
MSVSRLCLGCAKFGLDYPPGSQHPKPSHRESAAILEAAYAAGIRWVDTAAAYGDSEDLALSVWDGHLSTKVSPWLAAHGAVDSRSGWASAVLLHNPTVPELTGGAALDNLRGVCGLRSSNALPGASVYTVAEAEAAIAAGLKALQVPLWPFNQQHAATIRKAKAAGLTVFARQPFGRGHLFDPAYLGRAELDRLLKAHGITLVQAGLWFSLASPADYVVFGVANRQQLDEVIAAAEAKRPDSWSDCCAEIIRQCGHRADALPSVCTPQGR